MHVSRYLRAASTLFGVRYRKGRFSYLFRNRIDSNENPDSRLIINMRDNKRNAGDGSHQIFPFTSSLIVASCDGGSQNFLHRGGCIEWHCRLESVYFQVKRVPWSLRYGPEQRPRRFAVCSDPTFTRHTCTRARA